MDNQSLKIDLIVNSKKHSLEVLPYWTLLFVLRDQLGLTGSKSGCEKGECGSCTVLMDGKPIASCLTLAVNAHQREILTIEGLAKNGKPHPIQQSFIDCGAIQCGFCTPGMILSAKALLDRNPDPTEDEIRESINGNICRCTGYEKIIRAIKTAASRIQVEGITGI